VRWESKSNLLTLGRPVIPICQDELKRMAVLS